MRHFYRNGREDGQEKTKPYVAINVKRMGCKATRLTSRSFAPFAVKN